LALFLTLKVKELPSCSWPFQRTWRKRTIISFFERFLQ